MEKTAIQYKNRGRYEDAKKANRPNKPKRIKRVNWYWDIRIWIFPLIVLYLISVTPKKEVASLADPSDAAAESTTEFVAVETTAPVDPTEEEIVALARFADSVGAGRSNEVKRAIIWVVINRTEDRSHGYGRALLEELARSNQWQQYNPNGSYLESTYNLVTEVYNVWSNNGARMFQNDMLWFVLEDDGSVTVRNKFKETKGRIEINIV